MKKNLIITFFIIINISFANEALEIYTDNWYPYEYNDKGKVTGFSTEVIEGTLMSMQVKYRKPFITSWARGLIYLREGVGDLLYSGIYTEERSKIYHYPSESIIDSKWVLFVRKDRLEELKFSSYKDLSYKTFGVVSSYSYHDEFWDFLEKNQNYEAVMNDKVNFRKLYEGRVDYICVEIAVGISVLKDMNLYNQIVPIVDYPITSSPLYCFFSKKTVTKEFVSQFSEALKKFKETKEYDEIYNKYF